MIIHEAHIKDYSLSGEELEIYKFPAPVLKKKAQEVTEFDENLEKLCLNMLYTMYTAPGIGLAAPQVGISKRIFVIDTQFEREKVINSDGKEEIRLKNLTPFIFINPVLKNQEGEVLHQEGCLSFPGIFVDVKRAEKLTVEFKNLKGENMSMDVDELLSICVQHEFDHIEGIVFLDRLSMLKRNMLMKKFLKNKKKGK